MLPIFLTALLISSTGLAPQDAPKKLEDPFRVFVFAPEAPGYEKQAERAVKTVADQVKKRKDWFRLVETREEAEILIEVYSQGIGQPGSQSTISAPDTTTLTPSSSGGQLGVRESAVGIEEMANLAPQVQAGHHFFETEVSFPAMDSKVVMIGTASPNRRPSSAASDLAEKLEGFCKDRYPQLSEKRN